MKFAKVNNIFLQEGVHGFRAAWIFKAKQFVKKMPLPNYGHFNKEERKTQQLVFESPPQFVCVDHEEDCTEGSSAYGRHQKRAQITKGTMDIEVERKLVFRPPTGKKSTIAGAV